MACRNSSHVKESKSWVRDSTLWILEPRSQSSSAILDVTSPVKLVGKIPLGSKPPLVTRTARTGLSTRLWIMYSKYWIPEDLKRFQSLVGFDPDSKPRDSIFTSKNFPNSIKRKFIGFRIPYMDRRNTQMDQLCNLRLHTFQSKIHKWNILYRAFHTLNTKTVKR